MQIMQITLAMLFCHFLTGTASVTTRYLVSVLDPVEIACLRYLLGGLILLPLFFVTRSRIPDRSILVRIAGLGVLFFALFPFLFSWAFVHTSAARGSLVLATMPVWTLLLGKLAGHERITGLNLVAVILTLTGLTIALSDKLFTGEDYTTLFTGELIMFVTAWVGAIYAILSRKVLQKVSSVTFSPLAMLAGSLFLFPFAIDTGVIQHLQELTSLQLVLMMYLGVVAGGVAFFLFNWSIHRSSATFTTLFVPLNPITAIFLGNLFLGESIQANFIIGVLVVFSGLGFAVRAQIRHFHDLRSLSSQVQ